MKTKLTLAPDELKERVIEFYSKYNNEIESYKNKAIEQLQMLVNTYLKENNLPKGSMSILGRTKTLKSSLRKLKYKGWPQFDSLPEVITDLVGTRITCLFLSDCYGIEKHIQQSENFKITNSQNYIDKPKKSGYRAIHLKAILLNEISTLKLNTNEQTMLLPFTFEIQIKTKLQEAWGDMSHAFYLKSKSKSIINKKHESLLEKCAERLFNEDKILNKFNIIWQTIEDANNNIE